FAESAGCLGNFVAQRSGGDHGAALKRLPDTIDALRECRFNGPGPIFQHIHLIREGTFNLLKLVADAAGKSGTLLLKAGEIALDNGAEFSAGTGNALCFFSDAGLDRRTHFTETLQAGVELFSHLVLGVTEC